MSKIIYDFLSESPIFDPLLIENNYAGIADKDLEKYLLSYRDHVLKSAKKMLKESKNSNNNLSIQIEAFDSFLPDEKLLKQCALYMDKVVINDPIFDLTNIDDSISETMSSYLGMRGSPINRIKLAKALNYVRSLIPMVDADFVEFLPISYIFEPPKQRPVYFSEKYFSDIFPSDLLKWFHQHAKVHPLHKIEKGWYFREGESLEPCRAIVIHFKGHPSHLGGIYHLFETEVLSTDETTRAVEFRMYLPDEPPDRNLFNAWVFQSVNRYAATFWHRVFSELYYASALNNLYLTSSPFVAELLNLNLNSYKSLQTDTANLILKLELPIVENTTLERLIEVRMKDGEVFQNFRVELERHLRELRKIKDPKLLKIEIENIAHELSEVQVREVSKKISKIKRTAFGDAAILVASVAATIQTGGLGLIALTGAIAKGFKTYVDYISTLKNSPAYFLWKLKK